MDDEKEKQLDDIANKFRLDLQVKLREGVETFSKKLWIVFLIVLFLATGYLAWSMLDV